MGSANRHGDGSRNEQSESIRAIDLFCGVGGLTHGLEDSGIDVVLGIDIDPACEYPYATNNEASFRRASVERWQGKDLDEAFGDAPLKLLAGCAPCQPFSTYNQGRSYAPTERWSLLGHFSRLVKETLPHLVTMENVPKLAEQDVFSKFVTDLHHENYKIFCDVVDCADYGVPQHRRRLVLIASRLGPIHIVKPHTPKGRRKTVRSAIGDLPPLGAGETCHFDSLHKASQLSPTNMQRIRTSTPGGSWREWDEDLRARCHKRLSGRSYPSIYGRMTWDDPAPTITTQYYGFGNGRFGHPEQDRAISLREGAILQSFPKSYELVPAGRPIHRNKAGRLIGNAVPVELGKAIGRSIILHVDSWLDARGGVEPNLHAVAAMR